MPKKYKILWTNTATLDLEEIIDYISEESIQTARKILIKIKEKINVISNLPKKGRIIPELRDFNITKYREFIIKPWRIFYKIEDNTIYILSVIDSRRNVEDIILNRFLRDN